MTEEYRQDPQLMEAESEDNFEDALELQEGQQEQLDASFPTIKPESSIYNLFWKVYRAKDSTKTANLKDTELGMLNVPVREAQKVALLGHTFHHPTFGDFFYALGEITNATSMGRAGWFTELFVSQKKFTTRARRSNSFAQKRWQLFQRNQQDNQGLMTDQ